MATNDSQMAFDLAFAIKKARIKKGLTQRQAAARCELSLQCIRNIEERRQKVRPTYETLKKIESGLGLDTNELVNIGFAEILGLSRRTKEE